jgi:hypothetical protein
MNYCNQLILSLVREAGLSPEEIRLWEEIAENIPEKLCNDLYDTLKATPGAVRATTDNLKIKKEAILSGDIKKWEEVLDKESEFLLSLTKK